VGGETFGKLISALSFQGILYLYGALADAPTTLPVLDMIAKMLVIKGHNIWLTSGDEIRRKAAVEYITKDSKRAHLGRSSIEPSRSTKWSKPIAISSRMGSSARSLSLSDEIVGLS
jgi:NADPH:quinone reductase-like Zn-dependent oxidoreductase